MTMSKYLSVVILLMFLGIGPCILAFSRMEKLGDFICLRMMMLMNRRMKIRRRRISRKILKPIVAIILLIGWMDLLETGDLFKVIKCGISMFTCARVRIEDKRTLQNVFGTVIDTSSLLMHRSLDLFHQRFHR